MKNKRILFWVSVLAIAAGGVITSSQISSAEKVPMGETASGKSSVVAQRRGGNFPTRISQCREYQYTNVNLRYWDGTGVQLPGCRFIGSDLRYSIFQGANLQNVDLAGANLQHVDLRNVDLRGADLTNADLRHARMNGADLRGATITNADFRGTNLTCATLLGVVDNSTARSDETTYVENTVLVNGEVANPTRERCR